MTRESSVSPSEESAENNVLYRVNPEYPEKAQREGIEGPVVLDLYINADGSVQNVGVVSGPAVLANAATSAVRQWRFKPHVVDSRRVKMRMRVTIRFTLPHS